MTIEVTNGKLVVEYPSPWEGDFSCHNCNLTSLKGTPRWVKSGFYCFNNKLTSLEGAPEVVDRDFSCYNNSELLSIQNINHHVKKIGEYFVADDNLTGLISLLLIKSPPIYVDIGPLSAIFNRGLSEMHHGKDRMEVIMDVIMKCPEEHAWQLGDIE